MAGKGSGVGGMARVDGAEHAGSGIGGADHVAHQREQLAAEAGVVRGQIGVYVLAVVAGMGLLRRGRKR